MVYDFDPDLPEDEDTGAEGGSNRQFIMVAGGLGGLLLIALICMAVYALVILPRQRAAEEQDIAAQTATAEMESINQSLTETAIVLAFTPTFTQVPPTATETPEPIITSVPTDTVEVTGEATGEGTVEASPTQEVGGPTVDPRTQTVQALLTQAVAAQTQVAGQLTTATVTPTLIGALPDTGFIDDVGVPGLLAIAGLMVVVIFMARRLRQATA
jgi:hypothetical protein